MMLCLALCKKSSAGQQEISRRSRSLGLGGGLVFLKCEGNG